MIYITGDTHIPNDIEKLNSLNFPEYKNMTKEDYLIVCGDFGGVWDNSNEELYWREWLHNKPWTTLFVDGNHENFNLLNEFPIENKFGGKVHKINDSIYHLIRGQVFTIGGLKFFTFGGASSIDKENRIRNITWWEQEMPSFKEMNEGLDNLEQHNNKVDYIITHTCSTDTLNVIGKLYEFMPKPKDNLNDYLSEIEKKVKYKHWYFGHFHEDIKIDDRHTLIYEKIVKI